MPIWFKPTYPYMHCPPPEPSPSSPRAGGPSGWPTAADSSAGVRRAQASGAAYATDRLPAAMPARTIVMRSGRQKPAIDTGPPTARYVEMAAMPEPPQLEYRVLISSPNYDSGTDLPFTVYLMFDISF